MGLRDRVGGRVRPGRHVLRAAGPLGARQTSAHGPPTAPQRPFPHRRALRAGTAPGAGPSRMAPEARESEAKASDGRGRASERHLEADLRAGFGSV